MTPYKRGDVVLLPFPYTDQSGTKRRPALVLSTDAYNRRQRDVIVAPVTSNLTATHVDDTRLLDWAAAGLPKPSAAKGILGTVEQSLVLRVVGNLTPTDLARVEKTFAAALGLSASPSTLHLP